MSHLRQGSYQLSINYIYLDSNSLTESASVTHTLEIRFHARLGVYLFALCTRGGIAIK
jgi:hypothetical protein